MENEYYEDIVLNKPYLSRLFEVTEAAIIEFAREWNPEPYHIDKKAAAANRIGRIFACGPHLIAICTKLTNEKRPRPVSVAGLGWDNLKFSTPVFGGDSLQVEIQAQSKRRSGSNLSVGIVVYSLRLFNQHNQDVLTYSVTTMVECRASEEA